MKGKAALIDTGSPLTMRAPTIVSDQLGQPVRWLVGTDVLARERVLLDWCAGQLVTGGSALPGETIPLVRHAGLFQVEIESDAGAALAFLDSGAQLSYAPHWAVRGRAPIAQAQDYYPLFGSFDVPVYSLDVHVGRRRIRGRFGVLPPLLASLLSGIGGSGWILGSDFFRDRAIQLDLANNRLVDATRLAPRQRTTPRSRPDTAGTERRVARGGIEAWRGWRLVTANGGPRLQSITARDIWEGPCFTSHAPPTEQSGRGDAGVHAYATPGQMQAVLRGSALVYGQVTLHGEVCVHETGYRAEHVRIDRLYLRACGRHGHREFIRTGLLLHDVLRAQEAGEFCSCDALESHEWLTHEQLEQLARELGDQYQCDVVIDSERARNGSYGCSHGRRLRAQRTGRA